MVKCLLHMNETLTSAPQDAYGWAKWYPCVTLITGDSVASQSSSRREGGRKRIGEGEDFGKVTERSSDVSFCSRSTRKNSSLGECSMLYAPASSSSSLHPAAPGICLTPQRDGRADPTDNTEPVSRK